MRLMIVTILLMNWLGKIAYADLPLESFVLKCEGNSSVYNKDLPENFIDSKTHNISSTSKPYNKNIVYDVFVNKCKKGYDIGKQQDIELWGVTNNLIHNSNNPENVDMQVVIIQGRVLDANCVPISDATIRIMQPSLMSKNINYTHLGEDKNQNLLLVRETRGTATAITNNLGLFTLITRIPSVGKLPFDISLYILHPDFSNHYEIIPSNSKNIYSLDSLFPDLNIKQYIPLYRHDITLNQLNKYRTF